MKKHTKATDNHTINLLFSLALVLASSWSCSKGELLDAKAPVAVDAVVVSAGETRFVKPAGGVPPYQFTLISGAGALNSESGEYKAPQSTGTAEIRVIDSQGVTSATHLVVVAGPPAEVVLQGTHSVIAGQCSSQIGTSLKDSYGNESEALTQKILRLTNNGNGLFFSDEGCQTPITEILIEKGTRQKHLYFKATRAEAVDLVLSDFANQLASATLPILVSPAEPSKLAMSVPTPLVAGNCSAPFTLTTKDDFDNISSVSSDTLVTLSSGGAGTFYNDASCSSSTTTVTIAAGSSSEAFYFRGTNVQALSFSASAGASQSEAVASALSAAQGIVLSLEAPSSVQAGMCAPGFMITVKDAYGNAATVPSDTAVTLSGAGTGSFFSDASCSNAITSITLAAGTGSKAFYYRSIEAQPINVAAAATGMTGASAPSAVSPGSVSQISVSSPPSVTAGSCSSAFTITAKDSYGNVAAAAENLVFSLAGADTGSFFSDASCSTPLGSAQISSGASNAVFYYSGTVSGSLNVTVSSAGLDPASASTSVDSAAPGKLVLSGPTLASAGTCSSAFQLSVKDSFNNLSPVASDLMINLAGAGAGSFHSDSSCANPITQLTISSTSSSKSFYIKGNTAQALLLTASATSGTITAGTLPFSIAAATASTLALSGPSSGNDGACSAAYTITSRDAYGNDAHVTDAIAVSLDGAGSGSFFASSDCTGVPISSVALAASTSSKDFHLKYETPGTFTLAVNASGFAGANASITVNQAPPTRLALSGPGTVAAGSCSSAFTITTLDSSGNLSPTLADTTVNLSGAGAGTFYSDASCSTSMTSVAIASGSSSNVFYFKDGSVENISLATSSPGMTGASAALTVFASAPTQLAITGAASILAGNCSDAFTVSTLDSSGNPMPVAASTTITLGTTASSVLFSDSSCTVPISSITIAAESSTATFYLYRAQAASFTVSASSAGFSTASKTLTVTLGTATRLVITGPTTVNGQYNSFTVSRVDASGKFVPTQFSSLAFTMSGQGTGSFVNCSTKASTTTFYIGYYSASGTFCYYSNTNQNVTFSAASSGLASGTLSVTINIDAADKLTLTGPSSTVAGTCSSAFTVSSINKNNAVSSAPFALPITIANLPSTSAVYSDAACTMPLAQIVIPAGSTGTTFHLSDTRTYYAPSSLSAAGPYGFTSYYSPSWLTLSHAVVSAAPVQIVNGYGPASFPVGTCQAYTFSFRDIYGNEVKNSGLLANLTSSIGSFYSNSSCTTPTTTHSLNFSNCSYGICNVFPVYFKSNESGDTTLEASYPGITPASRSVTVTMPQLSIADNAGLEGCNVIFTVKLSGQSGLPVQFDWATQDDSATAPTRYAAKSGTGIIPAGQLSTTISVPLLNDHVSNSGDSFTVNLSNVQNAAISSDSAIGTIMERESATDLVKVNGNLYNSSGALLQYDITPDGCSAVYIALQDSSSKGLHIASPVGTPATFELSGASGTIDAFTLTPDGSKILYTMLAGSTKSLYVIDIDGANKRKLSAATTNPGVSSYIVSNDSSKVVFAAKQDSSTFTEVYSANLGTTGSYKVSDPLPSGACVGFAAAGGPRFVPSGSKIIYGGDQTTGGITELYAANADGSGTSLKLNGALVSSGAVLDYAIAPNGSRVVYRAKQESSTIPELYSVNIDGTGRIKLHPALTTGSGVSANYAITPDSSRVVYIGAVTSASNELFVSNISAQGAAKLNGSLVTGGLVYGFQVSADSQNVVYTATQETNVAYIYKTNIDGSGNLRLNSGGAVATTPFWISPNSQIVAYISNEDRSTAKELFGIGMDGTGRFKISDGIANSYGSSSDVRLTFSPDSSRIVYRHDQDIQYIPEVYIVNVDGTNRIQLNTAGARSNYVIDPLFRFIILSIDGPVHPDLYGKSLP